MTHVISVHQQQEECSPETMHQPKDLLSVIAMAVADPRCDVDKMDRLLAMHERIMADQRKIAFAAALARLQAKLPQINKDGRIIVKGIERSRFARLEDIDVAIKPLLAEEGFAFSFDEDSSDGARFKLSAKLSHRDGHSETKTITVPLDSSEYRTSIQSRGSTQSYAMRYLIKMHLAIVERNADNDGNSTACITEEQVRDIRTLITDTKSNEKKFLQLIVGVERIEDIPATEFNRAINALETKMRVQLEKASLMKTRDRNVQD